LQKLQKNEEYVDQVSLPTRVVSAIWTLEFATFKKMNGDVFMFASRASQANELCLNPPPRVGAIGQRVYGACH
jgi:hypothetical protein